MVPGYDEMRPLGADLWGARCAATGERVRLRRRRVADEAESDELRWAAAALQDVEHPHVLRLREVVRLPDAIVLAYDDAGGGTLHEVVDRRGPLSPAEAVTALAPVAGALAAIHDRGIVHGAVDADAVVFTPDGRPLLADAGVVGVLGSQTEAAAAADDVAALGRLAADVLGGEVPAALSELLAAATHPDRAKRPSADVVAATLLRAFPPEPVRLGEEVEAPAELGAAHGPPLPFGLLAGAAGDAATGPSDLDPAALGPQSRDVGVRDRDQRPAGAEGPRHAAAVPQLRWRGTLLLVGCILVLVVAAASVGVLWAKLDRPAPRALPPAPRPPSPTATAPAAGLAHTTTTPPALAPSGRTPGAAAQAPDAAARAPTDWRGQLARLDAARSLALARASPALLDRVYAPGSPALRRDREVISRLAAAGARAQGARAQLDRVRVLAVRDRRVVLAVTDRMPAYRITDATGRVIAGRAARGSVTWTVTMARAGPKWMIYDVARRRTLR